MVETTKADKVVHVHVHVQYCNRIQFHGPISLYVVLDCVTCVNHILALPYMYCIYRCLCSHQPLASSFNLRLPLVIVLSTTEGHHSTVIILNCYLIS